MNWRRSMASIESNRTNTNDSAIFTVPHYCANWTYPSGSYPVW